MRFAAVIFDFDGVIADSELLSNHALAESLSAIGMKTSYEDALRDYYGHNWQETRRRIEQRFGRPLPDEFRERHREHAHNRLTTGLEPVSGVGAFLEWLDIKPRAIASSSSAEYIHWALARFGFGQHFEGHVYSADGWDRGKPHPDIYLSAAQGLGVDPKFCLAIEDSPTGACSALAAGMTVIGFCGASHIVDSAAHGEKLRNLGVQKIALSYEEIPRAIY